MGFFGWLRREGVAEALEVSKQRTHQLQRSGALAEPLEFGDGEVGWPATYVRGVESARSGGAARSSRSVIER